MLIDEFRPFFNFRYITRSNHDEFVKWMRLESSKAEQVQTSATQHAKKKVGGQYVTDDTVKTRYGAIPFYPLHRLTYAGFWFTDSILGSAILGSSPRPRTATAHSMPICTCDVLTCGTDPRLLTRVHSYPHYLTYPSALISGQNRS